MDVVDEGGSFEKDVRLIDRDEGRNYGRNDQII